MAENSQSLEVKVEAPQGAETAVELPPREDAEGALHGGARISAAELRQQEGLPDPADVEDESSDADADRDPDSGGEDTGDSKPEKTGDQPGDGDDDSEESDGDGTTDDKPEKKGWLAGIKDTASSWLGDGIRDLIDLFENVLKWTGVAEFLRWLTNTPKEETEAAEDLSTEIATAIATVKNSTIKDALEERLKTITEDTEKTADEKEPLLEDLQKDTECYTRAEALEAKITADPKLKTEFEPKMKEIRDSDLKDDGDIADPDKTLEKLTALEQEFDAKAGAVAEAKAEAEKLPKDSRAEALRILLVVFELNKTSEFEEITEDWTVDELNGQYGKSLWNNFGWGEDARLAKRLIDVVHDYITLYPSAPPHLETDHVQDFIANIFKNSTYIAQFKAILAPRGIEWKPDGSTLGGTTTATEAETAETASSADLTAQRYQKMNDQLVPLDGTTINFGNGEVFQFEFPYTEQGAIQTVHCEIKVGNSFIIGGHTYYLELPARAQLQKFEIRGPVETGSTTLTAGAFMISDSKTIPLETMVGYLDELRAGPASKEITIDGQKATFQKVA